MTTNQWIEIKPGCEMPKIGERVLLARGNAWVECFYNGPDFKTVLETKVDGTHWMRVSHPPKPDPFETWFRDYVPMWTVVKDDARNIWNAAIASTKNPG